MADLPISFSAPMVRALLAGTKTQTRRLAPEPSFPADGCNNASMGGRNNWFDYWASDRPGTHRFKTKYAVGDRLYVREHWRVSQKWDETAPRDLPRQTMTVFCEAGGSIANQKSGKWEPDNDYPTSRPDWVGRFRQAMHMPKWASRITLVVTDVRVERLQDISEDDAAAEGWPAPEDRAKAGIAEIKDAYPIGWYAWLWDSINGPGAWAANPWVVAYSFRVVMGNIDKIERAA